MYHTHTFMILYIKKLQVGGPLASDKERYQQAKAKYYKAKELDRMPSVEKHFQQAYDARSTNSMAATAQQYVQKHFQDLNFDFSPQEQKLVDIYAEDADKQLYKYLQNKQQDKNWKEEYIRATQNLTFETLTDQLPELSKRYSSNPYVSALQKLPHVNKLKSGYAFFYEGKPLTALSDLAKIPSFSNAFVDLMINTAQENPTGIDLATLEKEYLAPVRLAGAKNNHIITKIGQEIVTSGKRDNGNWGDFNLPRIEEVAKQTNTTANDFVEFIEAYMVGTGKSYKDTIATYKKVQAKK
jgi:hypothetical protein